jgi:aspartokinase/homoserine dehydrogenase 1
VLSSLLTERGVDSDFVDARGWLTTDGHFGAACVQWEVTKRTVERSWQRWAEHRVTVHTGYIGQTPSGQTTTLGRNGSDYTATLLGGALLASKVVISTDVPGVMTCDPRIDPAARPVKHLTYSEAIELAIYGTKLFHPRTFLPLVETGVAMVIMQVGESDAAVTSAQ